MVVTKFSSCQGYLPFTWHKQTFQLENQVDHNIPFEKLQKMWVGGGGEGGVNNVCDTSLEFEFQLQFPCGSPSTELSDFRQSRRSGNECKCKQTLKNTCKG